MDIKRMIAIISVLSLIGCNLWSCSDNKTSDKSTESAVTTENVTKSSTAETTNITTVQTTVRTTTTVQTITTVQMTDPKEPTEKVTETENITSEEQTNLVVPEIDFSDNENNTSSYNDGDISLDSIVGTWKLSHYMKNNQPVYFDDIGYGYVFYADGTGYLYNNLDTWDFTYASTGTDSYVIRFAHDSNPAYCHIENGYFVSWVGYYYKRS